MRCGFFTVALALFAIPLGADAAECLGPRARMCPLPEVRAEAGYLELMAVRDCKCGTKTKCSQMDDCAEARCFLEKCGVTRLDGDKDGVPCEDLCG